jgi:hypothetical protein
MHLSLVSRTVFVDILSQGLAQYIGGQITILDSASKPLVLNLLGAGTGETLGPEVLTTWTNAGYGTLISTSKDITSAIWSGGNALTYSPNPLLTATAGELYKAVVMITLNSGTAPTLQLTNGTGAGYDVSVGLVSGLTTVYHTFSTSGAAASMQENVSVASNFSSVNSYKKVLSPSINGAVASIVSQDAAFNPNDTGGYMYTITPDNWNYRMGQHGFFKSA